MDILSYVIGKIAGGGGQPTPPSLTNLNAVENGTYSHSGYDGYDVVNVNVPNTYTAEDEGKVVSSGALVSQSATTKTANGTYDTTLNNSITINVPSEEPDLEDITITKNGTYESQDHDGFGAVTVNVSGEKEYNVLYVRNTPTKTTGQVLADNSWKNNTTSLSVSDYNAPCISEITIQSPEQIDTIPTHFCGFTTNGNGTVSAQPQTVSFADDFFEKYPNLKVVSDRGLQGLLVGDADLGEFEEVHWFSWAKNPYVTSIKCPNITVIKQPFETLNTGDFPNLTLVDFSGNTSITKIDKFCYNSIQTNQELVFDFSGCNNITSIMTNSFTMSGYSGQNIDIYLPVQKDEIVGAPWGATYATIHYGCTTPRNNNGGE